MLASLLGAGFPVMVKKFYSLKVPTKVFFACKHFGTGVLVAMAFLLPESFGSLTDPCLLDLFADDSSAMPGVVMMAGMFCLFVVEMWLHNKVGGHSHGNANGNVTVAPRRSVIMTRGQPAASTLTSSKSRSTPVCCAACRSTSVSSRADLFHPIFVGITVSLTVEGYLVLVAAITLHQMSEGLGLGSRIAEVPYPNKSLRPWVLVMAFGTTAPLGMAIGMGVQGLYDLDSAFGLILVGCCHAFSFGLLVWVAPLDLVQEDFLSEESGRVMTPKDKKKALALVLLGAAGMAIIGAFA